MVILCLAITMAITKKNKFIELTLAEKINLIKDSERLRCMSMDISFNLGGESLNSWKVLCELWFRTDEWQTRG